MTSRQCEIAAEAYTASLLAQCGYDVLVQYGANQPDYDLIANKGYRYLTISVKGSQDGGWMLAVRYKKTGITYHDAIEAWCKAQKKDTIFVLVSFLNVKIGESPRVYIARPQEIAAHMKTQCDGRGHGALQEDNLRNHPRSKYNHKIPSSWLFSQERIDKIEL